LTKLEKGFCLINIIMKILPLIIINYKGKGTIWLIGFILNTALIIAVFIFNKYQYEDITGGMLGNVAQ